MSNDKQNDKQNSQPLTEEVSLNQRRKLLLGIGATGAATVWHKPIVNAIVLPAHAQTSPVPSFTVEKTQSGGPNPAMIVGDVLEYTIIVTNTGGVPLTGVVATDTFPDGTVVVLTDPIESATADGILEVGEQWRYERTYTVTVADISAGAPLTNTVSVEVAEVTGPQTDGVDTPVAAAADVCAMVVTQNNVFGPVSGTSVPPVCNLTFDVLSGTPGSPLTIISITTNPLPANNVVTFDAFGQATDTTGPRVVWQGPAVDAPFCSDLLPIDQDAITFTVTATCDAAQGREFTQSFTLADVLL